MIKEIIEFVNSQLVKTPILYEEIEAMETEALLQHIYHKVVELYDQKLEKIPSEISDEFEKAIALRVIDTHWMEHINTLAILREGIYLRGYAQENPLRAYTTEGFELFENLLSTIDKETTLFLMNAEVTQNTERKQVEKGEAVTDETKTKKRTPKKVEKIGRNQLCPCGSGKKYKNCCGK